MQAIKARFDGRQIVLPPDFQGREPGDVIVVFENADETSAEMLLRAQEETFAKVWDNPDDEVYEALA